MALGDIIRPYFQLLGVMLLTSQTFLMALSIIFGVIMAAGTFIWAAVYLGVEILLSGPVLILFAWIFLYKRYSNKDILNFMSQYCGKKTIFDVFPCEKCQRFESTLFFEQCCHSYHVQCVGQLEFYVDGLICPKCYSRYRKYPPKRSILKAFFANIRTMKLFQPKFVIIVAVLYGCYLYAQQTWNIPNNMLKTTQES